MVIHTSKELLDQPHAFVLSDTLLMTLQKTARQRPSNL
jgi:hypothetical protein